MKNVYIVNGSMSYRQLFERLGYTVVKEILTANLVVFTGGEDVSPELYFHRKHHTTFNSMKRDLEEREVYNSCIYYNTPMVGICRGAQFLNVMSGGAMYQDVTGHTRDHLITDLETGDLIRVTSTHHQMMKPTSEAVIVASSTVGGRRIYWDGKEFINEQSLEDIEVVWYDRTRCLCFQPHPEFGGKEYENMVTYFHSLLERYTTTDLLGCSC